MFTYLFVIPLTFYCFLKDEHVIRNRTPSWRNCCCHVINILYCWFEFGKFFMNFDKFFYSVCKNFLSTHGGPFYEIFSFERRSYESSTGGIFFPSVQKIHHLDYFKRSFISFILKNLRSSP